MTERSSLISLGMPPAQAIQIGYSLSPLTLKALGTTKATALALVATMNVMGTVSANTGVALPPSSGNPPVVVFNNGANNLNVYTGTTTDVIDANSAGAAYVLSAGKKCCFFSHSPQWIANKSA